jgi:hypothetical protein
MFPFGHVGIGTHLIPRAVRERLPWRWLALGCLLPDLLDKPIWLTAQWLGVELPQLESARLFGHTAWFAAAFAAAARLTRAPPVAALAYAIPTHLVLDMVTDWGRGGGFGVWEQWLFWPLQIPRLHLLMVASPLQELGEELKIRLNVAGELLGAALLLWDSVRGRRSPKSSQ